MATSRTIRTGTPLTQSIADGDTTHAPSSDAVFDALALKFDKTGGEVNGATTFNSQTEFRNHNPELVTDASNGYFATSYGGSPQFVIRAVGGTEAVPLATPNGTALGQYSFRGYNGSAFVGSRGMISCATTEAWTTTANGTKLDFFCTPQGSTTLTRRLAIDNLGHIVPGADNTQNLGSATFRLKEVFCGNATINTSDASEKTVRGPLNAQELAAAVELASAAVIYQWNDAIADKGESARLHCGPTAQSVMAIMVKHGLDPFRYSFVCYDEWAETPEATDPETGEVVEACRPAGSRYGLRPTELQAFVSAGLAQRLATLEAALLKD